MVDYSDIQTELTNNWNGAVISEPDYYNASLKKPTRVGLYIRVYDSELKAATSNNTAAVMETNFLIKAVGTKDNVGKYISECARILTAMSVSGGHITLNRMENVEEYYSRYKKTLLFKEKKYRSYDNL